MAQIKYVVFACLILLAGFISFTSLQKISSSAFIEVRPSNNSDNGPTKTKSVDPEILKGEQLFRQNCGSCHALDKVLSGPALRGAMARGPWADDKENFKKWVKNPAAFIPTTQYTRDLQKQYGQIMPSFSLSNEEVEHLYQYLLKVPAVP